MAYKISFIPKYVLSETPAPMGSRSGQSAKADHSHTSTSCGEQGKRGETVIKTIFPQTLQVHFFLLIFLFEILVKGRRGAGPESHQVFLRAFIVLDPVLIKDLHS